MPPSLRSVGIVDLVDADPRPTFIVLLPSASSQLQPIDVDPANTVTTASTSNNTTSHIVHQNPALTTDANLNQALLQVPRDATHAHFWSWVSGVPAEPRPPPSAVLKSLSYLGVYWTRSVVLDTWAVMSGNELPLSVGPPRKVRLEAAALDAGLGRTQHSESVPSIQSIDFASLDRHTKKRPPPVNRTQPDTGLEPPDFMPDPEPFLDLVLSVKWESNSLGTMNNWPVRLQQAFNQIITDSRAIAIYWGPEYIAVYNEAFSKFCGRQHPHLLGQNVTYTWPHTKEHLEQLWTCPPQKRTKIEDESRFFIHQNDGSLEETYVKWSFTPIVENRQCMGVQHSLLETTSMRLWERRMKMLIDLGDALVTARDVKAYWAKTIEELERWSPQYDVPLAFVYSVGDDDDTDSSLSRYDCPRICHLEGSLGVSPGHPIAPATLELRDTDDGLAPSFREALKTQYALLVQTKDGTLPEKHLTGLQWRGFGDACKAAVICPIRPTRDENVMGILFLGLNPRRPYDNDYRQFISLLNQKLTSSLASTVLLEEEARRGRNAAEQAAYDRAMLQRKLAYQTEQANESIQNFQAVAEFIPVGMSFVDNQGNVTFANDAWYRITGYPKGHISASALLECVLPEDKRKILDAHESLKQMDVVTYEFRIARSDTGPDTTATGTPSLSDDRVSRHVLASSKAERADDGSIIRMLTCLTDVTEQKNTAEEAVRRAQQAENLKRLAEFATVGMYDINLDGRLLSANNLFWEFCGLPKVDLTKIKVEPWPKCVVEEDLPILQQTLDKLRATCRPQTAEIRLKTTWTAEVSNGNTIVAPRSVLATFMPVTSSDGVIQTFTGCLSDVSLQKWQLEQEKLRKEEAIDSRRQQENFIDMTSHEMRNPLSAILHCTDAIIASLSHIEDLDELALPLDPSQPNAPPRNALLVHGSSNYTEVKRLIKDSIENAETIVTCAQHQKRIVDDILTMSKLDSKLLAVTPCTVNPTHIVKDALKMFEVEARRVDIALTWVVEKSYTDLGYEYLDLDPSRVKQVLINLLTNALKFTRTGKLRNVQVSLKGSRPPPGKDMTNAEFIPRFCEAADEYEQPALRGRTNPVYLLFEVKDTGQGLTHQEMGSLFNKFVQASAKTHVKYGGSGLGLFISRRLTELQNGAIGVSSRPGVGSTFAFYIEAYVPSEAARRDAEATAAAAQVVAGADLDFEHRRGRLSRELRLQSKSNAADYSRLDGILVVEDNLINQQITRRGLTERGYSVDVANHGIEALEKLRRSAGANSRLPRRTRAASVANGASGAASPRGLGPHSTPIPINLVLMDIEMPIQDGLTCTRHIRELERKGEVFGASGGRIPIVAVTANARPEQITEAKAAGCDDVLVKPYRIPELVEKMQVVLRRAGGFSPGSPER